MPAQLCLTPLFVYDDDFFVDDRRLLPLLPDFSFSQRPRTVAALCVVASLSVALPCKAASAPCNAPAPIKLLPAVQEMAQQLTEYTALEVSGSVTLSPTLADFAANRLTVPGALRLNLHTKGVDGAQIFVSKLPGSSLAPAQMQLRVTGTKDYVTPGTLPTLVATVSGAHPTGTTLSLDTQVTNLRHLTGSGNGQRSRFTELMVFTVVPE